MLAPRHRALGFAAVLAVMLSGGLARGAPAVPCDATAAEPAFPPVDAPPNAQVWQDLDWRPPPCLGWPDAKAVILVGFAARFHHAGSSAELLGRFGAVSKLPSVRYWSTTEQQWNALFVKAQALDAQGRPRPDFSPAEIIAGAPLRFAQRDNRLPITTTQAIEPREVAPDRLRVDLRNVEPVELVFVTVADPGDLRTAHLLQRESGDVWRYYSLTRVASSPAILGGRNGKSWINRAAALYRHIAGIPTDLEPPVAR